MFAAIQFCTNTTKWHMKKDYGTYVPLVDDTCQVAVSLPTNSEAEVTIFSSPNIPNEDAADDIELGKYYVTLMTEGSCNMCCILWKQKWKE